MQGVLWQGRTGTRDRQAAAFLSWTCRHLHRGTLKPLGLEAYTCSLLHTMAQSLVFLVLIMSIHVVSHSGEVPIAAPKVLPEALTEVNWKKTLNLDLGCSKSEKAARRKLRRKGGLRRGSGIHTTSKSYWAAMREERFWCLNTRRKGKSERRKACSFWMQWKERGARQFHYRNKDLSLEKYKGKEYIKRLLANQTMQA